MTLRNDRSLAFTSAELEEATSRAAFHLRASHDGNEDRLYREIFDYANLCFCTMVKRVMEIGEAGDGVGHFGDAIHALNDGAITPELPAILGLSATTPRFGTRTSDQRGFIAWSRGHTVFASNGLYDHWGDVKRMSMRFPMRMQITG